MSGKIQTSVLGRTSGKAMGKATGKTLSLGRDERGKGRSHQHESWLKMLGSNAFYWGMVAGANLTAFAVVFGVLLAYRPDLVKNAFGSVVRIGVSAISQGVETATQGNVTILDRGNGGNGSDENEGESSGDEAIAVRKVKSIEIEICNTVNTYKNHINSGNYPKAWQMLSGNFKSNKQLGFEEYTDWWSGKQLTISNMRIVEINGNKRIDSENSENNNNNNKKKDVVDTPNTAIVNALWGVSRTSPNTIRRSQPLLRPCQIFMGYSRTQKAWQIIKVKSL